MNTLTPAEVALLQEAHAAADGDLDDMIAELRTNAATLGTVLAAAALTARLMTAKHLDRDYLAAMAGIAVARLASCGECEKRTK